MKRDAHFRGRLSAENRFTILPRLAGAPRAALAKLTYPTALRLLRRGSPVFAWDGSSTGFREVTGG
jgi:hypothetical protein